LFKQDAAAPVNASAPLATAPQPRVDSPSGDSPERPVAGVKLGNAADANALTPHANRKDMTRSSSSGNTLDGKRKTITIADEFSSDSDASERKENGLTPSGTISKEEEAKAIIRRARQEVRQEEAMRIVRDTDEEARQQNAMNAVKEAAGNISFREVLKAGHKEYSIDRDCWLKSLGVEMPSVTETPGPTIVKADTRTMPPLGVRADPNKIRAGPPLSDPNIMDAVRSWNTKVNPDDGPPKVQLDEKLDVTAAGLDTSIAFPDEDE
jgi:hypothetical protein